MPLDISKSVLIQMRANMGILPSQTEIDQLDAIALVNLAINRKIKLRRKDRNRIPYNLLSHVVVGGTTTLDSDEYEQFPFAIQTILRDASLRCNSNN